MRTHWHELIEPCRNSRFPVFGLSYNAFDVRCWHLGLLGWVKGNVADGAGAVSTDVFRMLITFTVRLICLQQEYYSRTCCVTETQTNLNDHWTRSCYHSPESVDHQWHPVASAINESLQPIQPILSLFLEIWYLIYVFFCKIFMMFPDVSWIWICKNTYLVFSCVCEPQFTRQRSHKFRNVSPLLLVVNGHKSKETCKEMKCVVRVITAA